MNKMTLPSRNMSHRSLPGDISTHLIQSIKYNYLSGYYLDNL